MKDIVVGIDFRNRTRNNSKYFMWDKGYCTIRCTRLMIENIIIM